MRFRTRFAPSPTGPLHLGHAYSAMLAHDMARAAGGAFLLRIEDIDQTRARPEWEARIHDDLAWLGLSWEPPVLRQSDRLPVYHSVLDRLWADGLLYACTCNRKDIAAAATAPNEGEPVSGPDGIVYPGTCRGKPRQATRPQDAALRLDMAVALARLGVAKGQTNITDTDKPDSSFATFREEGAGPDGQTGLIRTSIETLIKGIGDVVLARRDMGTSYHISVVVDDAHQDITHVVRGEDLFAATTIHIILQCLLGLPTPVYHHHRLIRDETGKRLAKRHDSRAIAKYRAEGATPADIRSMVGLA